MAATYWLNLRLQFLANLFVPGGANPAIRTLFYRLARLLGHSIQPIFVFDGPNKPAFKRNKRSLGSGDPGAKAMAKRLIRLFGFAVHDAPGEAEAECALLQQQGIVDAVLSEDVDTVMFGCTRTLRNWSSETKGNKTPTHVSVYDTAELRQSESGLDREGMVLVALMSGGDYIPEGIPGCGVKVACEAAKAGFGHSLCRIKMADKQALAEWKGELLHELKTNESGHFRTRHKALVVPESFPNMEVLRYYTHPVVSQQATLDKLRDGFPSKAPVDIIGLREFVRDTFDWAYRIGAIKLIRVLAPNLLVQALVERSEHASAELGDLDAIQQNESSLIKAISSRRIHFSTDATPELRVSYIPASIVQLDLGAEPQEVSVVYGREGLALNSDDEFEEDAAENGLEDVPKATSRKKYDPSQPELVWVPESVAKLGVPLAVEDWEERQRAKESRIKAKSSKARPKKKDMPAGALDQWVKVSKPSNTVPEKGGHRLTASSSSPSLPCLPSGRDGAASRVPSPPLVALDDTYKETSSTTRSKKSKQSKVPATASLRTAKTNPWALAGSQSSPRVTKITGSSPGKTSRQPIVISSSPHPSPPSSPQATNMRTRRLQSSPVRNSSVSEPFGSPNSSPKKQRSSPGPERMPSKARRVRDRKRDESESEDKLQNPTQTSIKDYGFLSKARGSRANTKASAQPDVIELSGDETDGGAPLGLLAGESANPGSGLPAAAVLAGDDPDDPFGPTGPCKEGLVTAEVDADGGAPRLADGSSKKTRLYMSRLSDVGYFEEVEVTAEEADRLRNDRGASSASRTILRYSDVSIVDLTSREA